MSLGYWRSEILGFVSCSSPICKPTIRHQPEYEPWPAGSGNTQAGPPDEKRRHDGRRRLARWERSSSGGKRGGVACPTQHKTNAEEAEKHNRPNGRFGGGGD